MADLHRVEVATPAVLPSVKRWTTTERNRRLDIGQHAVKPAVWLLFLSTFAVASSLEVVAFVILPVQGHGDIIPLVGKHTIFWLLFFWGFGIGCAITWWDFRFNIMPPVYDELVLPRVYESEQPAPQPAPQERGPIPFNQKGVTVAAIEVNRPHKVLPAGKEQVVFSGPNLDALERRVRGGYLKVKRDGDANEPGFNSLPDAITSSRYSLVKKALEDAGYVTKDETGGLVWSVTGVLWLTKV